MSKELVIRNSTIKIPGTIGFGTGDDMLTLNSVSKSVTKIPSIDTSTYLTTSLASGRILIGNTSGVATPLLVSGDISLSNLGVASLSNEAITNIHISSTAEIAYSKLDLTNSILNADINTTAGIARSKLSSGTAYRVVVNNSTGVMEDAAAITAARVLISDSNGIPTHSTITSTTLGYLDATSSIQTQLNNKLTFSSGISPSDGDIIYYDSGSWVTLAAGSNGDILKLASGVPSWDTVAATGVPTGGTAGQYLNKIDGTNYNTQWSTLTVGSITDLTATADELNHTDGVSSNIQIQLNERLTNPLTTDGDLIIENSGAKRLGIGTAGYVLSSSGGFPAWTNITAGATNEFQKNSGSATFARTRIYSTSDGSLILGDNTLAGAKTLSFTNDVNTLVLSANPTAARTVTIQDGSGTLAFLSDISGGIGGSTGSVDNAILRADGAGGNTVQASSLFISDTGNLTLGSASLVGNRIISIVNSTSDAQLTIQAQSDITITSPTGIAIDSDGEVLITSGANVYAELTSTDLTLGVSGELVFQHTNNFISYDGGGLTAVKENSSGNDEFTIVAANGLSGAPHGQDFILGTGNAYGTGDNNSGSLYLRIGIEANSGLRGNIGFNIGNIADWQDMENGAAWSLATAAPTAGILNSVAMWAEDLNSSAELYVMSESGAKINVSGLMDQIEESGTSFTLDESHRGKLVWCSNGSAVTVTVPAGLPVGFNCIIMQDGAGTVTLSTGAVTAVGKSATTAQYDTIGLIHYKTGDNYLGR